MAKKRRTTNRLPSGKAEPVTACAPGRLALGQLESHLWEAANILRGPVDAADFKTYVFPLLFG